VPRLTFWARMLKCWVCSLPTRDIKEITFLMTIYSGFPSAINETNALKEVVNKKGR